MSRVALGIEYDGVGFSGWQRQAHAPSVQAALEQAISEVAQTPITVTAAGRTDAGVHACGQVVHFDTPVSRPDRAWQRGVNRFLPAAIGVRWVAHPGDDFDARRSGLARRYRYCLLSSPQPPVLLRDRVSWTWQSLNAARMHTAAQCLVGEHDFTSFRAAACQAAHPRRCLTEIQVHRHAELITIDIEANAFLHHMVRNIVGSLMVIGRGEQSIEWMAEVLAARDRTLAGMTAPAPGLYLLGVRYPQAFGVPGPARGPSFA